jgi:hypothetical protein
LLLEELKLLYPESFIDKNIINKKRKHNKEDITLKDEDIKKIKK